MRKISEAIDIGKILQKEIDQNRNGAFRNGYYFKMFLGYANKILALLAEAESEQKQLVEKITFEKNRRVHWQGLAYKGMDLIDLVLNQHICEGTDIITEEDFVIHYKKTKAEIARLQDEKRNLEIGIAEYAVRCEKAEAEIARLKAALDAGRAEK